MNANESFRDAMRRAGINHAAPIVGDGKLHRFRADGDHARNSWYVLHGDTPAAGAFGCWKRQIKETWRERGGQQLTPSERDALRRRVAQIEAERERADAERREDARKGAAWILGKAGPPDGNGYLQRKGVKALGNVRQWRGSLVVPLRDAGGALHSLQFIRADGSKKFLSGGRVVGCFFTLAERADGPLVICEGVATGASIHEATGWAVVAAMDCGNLLAVAKALREKWPARDIIIAADNDAFTDGNPGATKASEAVKAIGARSAVPQFKDTTKRPTDFNDLQHLEGIETVKEQIEGAEATEASATPNRWFKARFPKLAEKYGEPIQESQKDKNLPRVVDICEDFMAATLGEDGHPEAPTVFLPTEDRFYSYVPAVGVFVHQREPDLSAVISALYLECARACRGNCEMGKLEFGLRDTAAITGVVRRARAMLKADAGFFSRDVAEVIPVANGMLRLADHRLLAFSPSYHCRNKLAVPYDASAGCPLFLETLLQPALDADDINLLQRWCGLALLGENLAQRLLLLTGTAGGGKGAFVRVVCGVIGAGNLASLRTDLLTERFELGRFLGRTLLYGADVPDDFLNKRSAGVLKALTGGDPVTVEFKNSNEQPELTCRFNVIITSNSRLTVHLEGDSDAWRRRLAIVKYEKPKPAKVIPDLSERILREEGAGVLNWMLAGLAQLRAADWQLHLNTRQQARVDDLLLESDSHGQFAIRCLRKDGNATLTLTDAFAAYVEFCNDNGWAAITRNRFGRLMPEVVVQKFGAAIRRDIKDSDGKQQQGWKGIRLLPAPERSQEEASEPSAAAAGWGCAETSEAISPLVAPAASKELVEEVV